MQEVAGRSKKSKQMNLNPSKKAELEAIGDYLRRKREANGLTQYFVAQKLGYSSSQFVSNVERGLSSVPLKALKVLVDLYKLNPDEVIELILSRKRERLLQVLKYGSQDVQRGDEGLLSSD
jgi:transcriptional regulator with XRE-family HTH domain